MLETIASLFSADGFMPHGHCYLWRPGLLWTMAISDSIIGLAYISISFSLYALVRRIKLPFTAMFLAFGVFIGACGATHFMDVYTLWIPRYWLSAVIRLITALASVATAIYLIDLKPRIVRLAESAKEATNKAIVLEKTYRDRAVDQGIYSKLVRQNIIFPLALTLGLAAAYVGQVYYLLSSSQMIAHTDRVIGNAQEVQKLFVDAETGVRGYVITADERYLQPYQDSLSAVRMKIRDLENLISNSKDDETPAQAAVQGIQFRFSEWQQYAQTVISRVKEGGRAPKDVVSGAGKAMMDDLRSRFSALLQSQEDLRQQRIERTSMLTSLALAITITLTLFSGLVLAVVGRRQLLTLSQNYSAALQELQSSIEVRDEFLSIASHELKTPITSLKLQMQLMRRNMVANPNVFPERFTKALDTSNRQIDRLTGLVEDLLDVAKIQAGKLSLSFEPVNLSELVADVVERFRGELEAVKTAVTVSLAPDVVGNWDRSRLEQIVVNLVSNAVKYAPHAALEIRVQKDSKDRSAELEVIDTGPGIAIERQGRIFERFERAVSSRNISGLGLGLFIVRQIAEAHGGTITLRSAEGQGAAFLVRLPLTTNAANAA